MAVYGREILFFDEAFFCLFQGYLWDIKENLLDLIKI